MENYRSVRDLETLKTIGDHRRLDILRLLMVQPSTLTRLGVRLDLHPAKVRYHLKLLEKCGLVEFVSSREVRGFVEKYYRATAEAFFINQVVLPITGRNPAIVALGSHDPALELLADYLLEKHSTPQMITVPVGSLDGLIALRQGLCHFAGCHLYDPVEKEFNISYIRHLFPDQAVSIVTLAHRTQGLLVAKGNPYAIQGLEDLLRDDIVFINRKKGSGTRLWLDQQLKEIHVDLQSVCGYSNTVNTHSSVAEAILTGKAQVGLGVMAAANRCGLGFIPLFRERFDLVIHDEILDSDFLGPAMDYLQTATYRNAIVALGGYDPHDTGKLIHI